MINLNKLYKEKGPCASKTQYEEIYVSLAIPKRSPREMTLELEM